MGDEAKQYANASALLFCSEDDRILSDCNLKLLYCPAQIYWLIISLQSILVQALILRLNQTGEHIKCTFLAQIGKQANHQVIIIMMKRVYQVIGLFFVGLIDSLSLTWIKQVLFYTDPQTKKILPQSIRLQKLLLRSVFQAGVITTLLPLTLKWLGFQILSWIVMGLSLIFTYGYLVFYNMDVTRQALEIIIWKTKKSKESMPELDVREKIDPITDISNQIQSFIFQMVYYTPVNLILILISLFDQKYSPWVIATMDCFFNTAFYYFRKWPYDKYNVAFLQAHMSYAMGYGAFVSVVTNVFLPSSMSIGGYLLISQWMIINALCHTVPSVQFNSFGQIFRMLKREQRRKLPSAYNIHRKKMRQDKRYREQLMKNCYFMKSFFILTGKINELIQRHLFKHRLPGSKREEQSPSKQISTEQCTLNLPKIIEEEEEETQRINITTKQS